MPLTHEFDPHTFKAEWKHVSAASWRKYPHPKSDIISVDIIRKEYDQEAGLLKVRRFIISQPSLPFPSWFPSLPTRLFFVEDSVINVKDQTYTLNSINLGITRSLLKSNETCHYSQDAANPQWTVLNQKATTSSPVWLIGSHIEQFFCDQTVPNVTKGRGIMDDAIEQVQASLQLIE